MIKILSELTLRAALQRLVDGCRDVVVLFVQQGNGVFPDVDVVRVF
jgi:hypothetical protein